MLLTVFTVPIRRQPLVAWAALAVGMMALPVQRGPGAAPETIQPSADRLLDHAHLVEAIRRLATSDRVAIEMIGTSAGGLSIPMAVITGPGPSDERRRQALRISAPDVRYTTL